VRARSSAGEGKLRCQTLMSRPGAACHTRCAIGKGAACVPTAAWPHVYSLQVHGPSRQLRSSLSPLGPWLLLNTNRRASVLVTWCCLCGLRTVSSMWRWLSVCLRAGVCRDPCVCDDAITL